MSKKLRGYVSTRVGIAVSGFKSKFCVPPGLQDLIVPIANAQINALASKNTSAVYVTHNNNDPVIFPEGLQYLNTGNTHLLGNRGLTSRLLTNDGIY